MIKATTEKKISNELNQIFNSWVNSQKSEKTQVKYASIVTSFSQMIFEKEVCQLTEADFNSIRYSLVFDKYISLMKERVKDSTIKNYLKIISSFLDYVDREEVFSTVNFRAIRKNHLNTNNLAKDMGHVKPMSLTDFDLFKDWLLARDFPRTNVENVSEKYITVADFMFKTALRVSVAFKIKWTDFEIHRSMWNNTSVRVSAMGKGSKLNVKYISVEYYEEIKQLLKNDSEYVFGELNQRTFASLMEKFSEETGCKMTPHSIKVGAGTQLYARTKDIVKTQQFLDHNDIQTTVGYIRDNGNPEETGAFILSTEYNYADLESLSKEDLLRLIRQREDISYSIYSDAKNQGLLKNIEN